MLKVIDISVAITSQFPPWPGDPAVKFHTLSSIEKGDESNLTQISMSLHTGTHIDAPKHFLDQGITTDDIALSKLIGRVLVVEIDQSVDVITESLLINHPKSAVIKETTKILLKQEILPIGTYPQNSNMTMLELTHLVQPTWTI